MKNWKTTLFGILYVVLSFAASNTVDPYKKACEDLKEVMVAAGLYAAADKPKKQPQ